MQTVSATRSFVQACFTTPAGMVLRIDGKTRPATLDEIEQTYTQAKLFEVMENPGQWVTLAGQPDTIRCRCWARRQNLEVVVIADGRKLEVQWHHASEKHLPLYQRIVEAHNDSWNGKGDQSATGKAYIELTAAEILILATLHVMNANGLKVPTMPTLSPITSRVRMPVAM